MNLKFLSILLLTLLLGCKKDRVIEPIEIPQMDPVEESKIEQTLLIEPTVSVGCGICPLAHKLLEEIEAEQDDVVHMSHYLYGPLSHPYTAYLIEKVNKTLYTPIGHVNRRHEGESIVYYDRSDWEGILQTERTDGVDIGLECTVQQGSGEHNISVKVFSENEAHNGEELRISLFVIEKSVVGTGPGYDQRNYGDDDSSHPFYGQGDPIEGFEHTNVIRDVLTEFEGDAFTMTNGEAELAYTVADSSLSSDAKNYAIIGFVNAKGDMIMPILNTTYQSF